MTDFFDQLKEFSERVFHDYQLEEKVSPWRGDGFKGGKPIGVILHFTSGSSIRRTLRWFMEKRFGSKVSAHAVVADGWPEEWEEFAQDLPLVKELPAAVVQCVPPDTPAWHATWTNSLCYGIEMVNAGELKPDGKGGFTWWPDNYTRPWHPQGAVFKEPIQMYGRYWEPYTPEQVMAVVHLLREVQQFHGTLQQYMILGHEQVTERKLDPGPLLPIEGMRQAVYEPGVHPSAYQWFKQFSDDRRYGETWRDSLVRGWCMDVLGQLGINIDEAWFLIGKIFRNQFLRPKGGFGSLGRVALKLLGYFTTSTGGDLTPDEKHTIEVFQRMMRLKVDGIPGPVTKAALVSRLENRGVLS